MKRLIIAACVAAVFTASSCTTMQKHKVVPEPKTKQEEVSLETQAKNFYEDGKYPEAIDNLRALLKKDPKNPKYWSQLGSAYAQINQLDYSIESFKNAIKYDPKNIKAMYNLSIVYGEKGNPTQAMKVAKQALKLQPKNPLLQASLGNSLIDTEDYKNAKKVYTNIVTAKPDFEVGHFNLGIINYKERNLDDAEKNYMEALSLNGSDVDARQNLSAIYILQNKYEEAIQQLNEVIEMNPDDDITLENAYFNLGVANLRLQKYPQALKAFETAIDIEPWDMAAYVNAAIIAEELGQNEKAIKYWTRYDRLLPVNKRKKEIKAKLKQLGAKTEPETSSAPVTGAVKPASEVNK